MGKKAEASMTEAELAADRVRKREAAGLTSATPERLMQAGADGYEHGQASMVQRIVEAPLDRLFKAGTITRREHEAGQWFRTLAAEAQVEPGAGGGLNLDRVDGGSAGGVPDAWRSDRIMKKRREWRDLQQSIPPSSLVWTMLYLPLVVEMPLATIGEQVFARRDRKEAAVAATAAFRVALSALADRVPRLSDLRGAG